MLPIISIMAKRVKVTVSNSFRLTSMVFVFANVTAS
jgi:hypothetical protein